MKNIIKFLKDILTSDFLFMVIIVLLALILFIHFGW